MNRIANATYIRTARRHVDIRFARIFIIPRICTYFNVLRTRARYTSGSRAAAEFFADFLASDYPLLLFIASVPSRKWQSPSIS